MSNDHVAEQGLRNLVIQGRFHIYNKVGQGSFGAVYFAIDKKTGRPVAVKTENQNQKNKQTKFEGYVL